MADNTGALHLDEATWERLACDELQGPERDAAFDHVTTCDECARVYRAVSALRGEAARFDPNVPAEATAIPTRTMPRWAFATAAVAAGLVLLLVLPQWIRQPAPTERVSSIRGDGLAPVTVEPRGVVKSGPRVFRWEGVASAETYRMRLLSPDGVVLWSSPPVTATVAEPPATVVFDDGIYFWDVSAHRAGERIGESELTRFEVRR